MQMPCQSCLRFLADNKKNNPVTKLSVRFELFSEIIYKKEGALSASSFLGDCGGIILEHFLGNLENC
jgi:hypothetical protein